MSNSRFYPLLALVALILVIADVTYFSRLAVAQPDEQATSRENVAAPAPATAATAMAPAAPAAAPPSTPVQECGYDPAIPPVADYGRLVNFGDPFLGSPEGKVQVVEYFDPNCPHCRTYHAAMMQIIATHADKAKFYMVPFMLWPQISLLPIEALYVAAQDGKYHEMLELQFREQGQNGYTVEQLTRMAEEVGLNGPKFAERVQQGLNRQSIYLRRQQIAQIGIGGTPAVVINGRVVLDKSVACVRQLIDEAAGA